MMFACLASAAWTVSLVKKLKEVRLKGTDALAERKILSGMRQSKSIQVLTELGSWYVLSGDDRFAAANDVDGIDDDHIPNFCEKLVWSYRCPELTSLSLYCTDENFEASPGLSMDLAIMVKEAVCRSLQNNDCALDSLMVVLQGRRRRRFFRR